MQKSHNLRRTIFNQPDIARLIDIPGRIKNHWQTLYNIIGKKKDAEMALSVETVAVDRTRNKHVEVYSLQTELFRRFRNCD